MGIKYDCVKIGETTNPEFPYIYSYNIIISVEKRGGGANFT